MNSFLKIAFRIAQLAKISNYASFSLINVRQTVKKSNEHFSGSKIKIPSRLNRTGL